MINGHVETELEELKRITPNISALIDSERSKPNEPISSDRQAFVDICKAAAINIHVLHRRAIENYFPDRAVKLALGESYKALGEYEKLSNMTNAWPKSHNWQVARKMDAADFETTDLGTFVMSL